MTLRDLETYTADIKDIQTKVELGSESAALAHNKRIDDAHEKAVDNLMRGLPWWWRDS